MNDNQDPSAASQRQRPKNKRRTDRVDLGEALNHLLNAETRLGANKNAPAGLELPDPQGGIGKMSVIVIAGRPGSGKSTLALQIVTQAAKAGFCSLYLSLEDHPESVLKKARDFGTKPRWSDLVHMPGGLHESGSSTSVRLQSVIMEARRTRPADDNYGTVVAASLLPRPVDDSPNRGREFFLQQYAYLETLVKGCAEHSRMNDGAGTRIVVIDSLNMLSYPHQSRESLYRFFDLFRANATMGIFVADVGSDVVPFDSTMADVVFRFSSETDASYLIRYLSVEKSRYTSTAFGLHPYKISQEHGIKVLPSLHTVVAATQRKDERKRNTELDFPFGWGKALTNYVVRSSLHRPGVVALHGPHGTRKSTIALNFLIHGLVGEEPRKKGHQQRREGNSGINPSAESGILIRLKDAGEYTELSKVEAYPTMHFLRQLRLSPCQQEDLRVQSLRRHVPRQKAGIQVWGIDGRSDAHILVVLDFHTGMLLPEEFVEILRALHRDIATDPKTRVRRVALDDVSAIGGGSYPLLRSSQTTSDLFLAAFVHLMRNWSIDLMLVGTKGQLAAGNEVVDRAIALADSVVETRIHDIFGDRYVLLSGDGSMAQDAKRTHESVPPVLRLCEVDDYILPKKRFRMFFDKELLRGLTGFDGNSTVSRTSVFAYLYKENEEIHGRYNESLRYLVEPYCGLPGKDKKTGLQVIDLAPDISDSVHRSLLQFPAEAPPKAHTVISMLDEFVPLNEAEKIWPYTNNVLLVAWRADKPNPSGFSSWRALEHFARQFQESRNPEEPGVWVDRVAKETLSCCLLDCLFSGWMLEHGRRLAKAREAKVLREIVATLSSQRFISTYETEAMAMHDLLRTAHGTRAWRQQAHVSASSMLSGARDIPGSSPEEPLETGLPRTAGLYICWYSQLRHLIGKDHDIASGFQVAPLPAGGFNGDWRLRVLPGSVSEALGEQVLSILTSPEEDYRRFAMGVGLPARSRHGDSPGDGSNWRSRGFRAWSGANESVTLDRLYEIHQSAHRRSVISNYPVISRVLSTFAMRLAGDWESGAQMTLEAIRDHLRRLPKLVEALGGVQIENPSEKRSVLSQSDWVI